MNIKRFNRYIIPISALALVVILFSVHFALAQGQNNANSGDSGTSFLKWFGLNLPQFIAESLAHLFFTLQTICSWFIAVAGALLNFSINQTLNIKSFVEHTPAIYSVWKAVRDISGMIIIFSLLYAALRLILGFDAKFGDLIKNIVIAGLLINFSFFVTGVGIDASNVISIQLYNTIAPANSLNPANMNPSNIEQSLGDGGLSDVFMRSLNVSSLYDNSASLSATAKNDGGDWTLPLSIIIRGVTSIIIMVTAALSFFFAALAFMIRIVVLILLLGFSPIWFASHVLPQLKEYSTKWTDLYVGQLLFMPVYLLLMYFALNVLTTSDYLQNVGQQISTGSMSDQGKLMGLVINAIFVIIMINIPLLAAVKIGGATTSWINTKKYGAEGVSKWIGSRTSNYVGKNTVGKAAYALNDSKAMKNFAAFMPGLGGAVSKGLGKAGNAGFGMKKGGYEDTLKETKKNQAAMFKKIGGVDRSKYGSEEEYQKALAEASGFQKQYARNVESSYLSTPVQTINDKRKAARIAEVDALGIAHYGSEEEYQNARAEAAKDAWYAAPNVGKVLSYMFDSRAHKESGFTLNEEANIKQTEADHKAITERIEEITEKETNELDAVVTKIKAKEDAIIKTEEEIEKFNSNPSLNPIEEVQRDNAVRKLEDLKREKQTIEATKGTKEMLQDRINQFGDFKALANAGKFEKLMATTTVLTEADKKKIFELAVKRIPLTGTIERVNKTKEKEREGSILSEFAKKAKESGGGGSEPKEEKPKTT